MVLSFGDSDESEPEGVAFPSDAILSSRLGIGANATVLLAFEPLFRRASSFEPSLEFLEGSRMAVSSSLEFMLSPLRSGESVTERACSKAARLKTNLSPPAVHQQLVS